MYLSLLVAVCITGCSIPTAGLMMISVLLCFSLVSDSRAFLGRLCVVCVQIVGRGLSLFVVCLSQVCSLLNILV